MASILFLTLDGGGNVAPVIPIALELQRRGHSVRVLGAAAQRDAFESVVLAFAQYSRVRGWSPRTATGLPGALGFAQLLSDRGYAREVTSALERDGADVIVMDALMPASIAQAARGKVPVVVLMHSFAEFFLRNPAINALSALQRVRPQRAWRSASSVLVASDATLDPASRRTTLSNLVWTGVAEAPPTEAPVPVHDGGPRLLISLSTVAAPGQESVFQRILEGVSSLPVTAIATTGPAIDRHHLRAGDNTELLISAPHGEILPEVDLVIGHGGHSTTMRALMHGRPLVIIPCDTRIDQPLIGAAVDRAGAGILLRKSAPPNVIASAVTAVLAYDSFRKAADEIGQRLRRAHGAEAAADAILAAVR